MGRNHFGEDASGGDDLSRRRVLEVDGAMNAYHSTNDVVHCEQAPRPVNRNVRHLSETLGV